MLITLVFYQVCAAEFNSSDDQNFSNSCTTYGELSMWSIPIQTRVQPKKCVDN
jgi:hypothetical protein